MGLSVHHYWLHTRIGSDRSEHHTAAGSKAATLEHVISSSHACWAVRVSE
jgi:hypothetical protein